MTTFNALVPDPHNITIVTDQHRFDELIRLVTLVTGWACGWSHDCPA